MSLQQQNTVYDMKEIIKRCFDECAQAKYIEVVSDKRGLEDTQHHIVRKVILNEDQVADHISKTLIGELLEFELVRRMAPWFRSFFSINKDLEILTQRQQAEASMQGLRIGER